MKQLLSALAVLLCFASSAQTLCELGDAGGYPCNNIDLMSHMPTSTFGSGIEFNDIWGWTDATSGREFALLGVTNGTAFVEVTDPLNPVYLGNLPTQTTNSLWRDVKVYSNHAFIVSEAGSHGMQIFDLTQLLSVAAPPQTFTNTAFYSGFGSAHNIVINEAVGYAYGVGTNTFSGGLHIVDISDPANPVIAGDFALDGYTHDAQVVTYNGPDAAYVGREIAFACNEDEVTIVDVNDPTDTQELSATGYAGSSYVHQGWLSEDHTFFFSNDELDESNNGHNTRTYIWNVSDLNAPFLVGFFESSIAAIDHNLYTDGNLMYQSNYRGGLRMLDYTNAAAGVLSEVAYFDLYPASNSANFNGSWSNYPYFPSGNVIVSHIEEGLFVLRPRFVDANIANPLVCADADFDITVDVAAGFTGPVTLSMPAIPAGFSVSFSANGVSPGSYTATISNPGALEGTFDFTVEAVGTHFSYASTLSITTYDCASTVLGCTDPAADNYNPAATLDDGSCTYPCFDITFTLDTDCWGNESSWSLLDGGGALVASGTGYGNLTNNVVNLCLPAGCYDFTMSDSFGDGLSGASYAGCGIDGNYVWTDDASAGVMIQMLVPNFGGSETQQFCLPFALDGCTDAGACNYDAAATNDDGSCEYLTCAGCTDNTACNFDPTATIDDASCILPDGCTDNAACNYNAAALCDDGSCILPDGCTDNTACNYNAAALCDDGSCILPDGCTDNSACNYNAAALCDDGSCILPDGCTDNTACNYNAAALCDDGSCILPDGCTDNTACNYNAAALCDDGSCILPDGCTDNSACNYDAAATCDDGTCEYASCASCFGDLNFDGERGVSDILIILGNFNCMGCAGDLDENGTVGTSDVLALMGVYGVPCP